MADTALAVEVGKMQQQMKSVTTRRSRTSRKSSSKKPSKKKRTLKKWKLERVVDQTRVIYQKLPKKGYILIVPKNAIVRDTTENRAKYANVPYVVAPGAFVVQ